MSEDIKRMADYLRKGATMLSESCPECNSPLFKIHEDVWCPKCNKRVVIVKSEEEAPKESTTIILSNIDEVILNKIHETIAQIKIEKDPDRLQKLGNLLSTWLEALEKLRKIK